MLVRFTKVFFILICILSARHLGPTLCTKKSFKEELDLNNEKAESDSILINEVQLLLAEKRTSLAVMRTGIAVLVLPMSVMSVLIATSKYYDVLHVLHFLVLLGIVNLALIILGAYLIIRSIIRMRHYDRFIHKIKLKHSVIGEFID
jgi:uncharacterized membrane protein YidH (DUF202 family)